MFVLPEKLQCNYFAKSDTTPHTSIFLGGHAPRPPRKRACSECASHTVRIPYTQHTQLFIPSFATIICICFVIWPVKFDLCPVKFDLCPVKTLDLTFWQIKKYSYFELCASIIAITAAVYCFIIITYVQLLYLFTLFPWQQLHFSASLSCYKCQHAFDKYIASRTSHHKTDISKVTVQYCTCCVACIDIATHCHSMLLEANLMTWREI